MAITNFQMGKDISLSCERVNTRFILIKEENREDLKSSTLFMKYENTWAILELFGLILNKSIIVNNLCIAFQNK